MLCVSGSCVGALPAGCLRLTVLEVVRPVWGRHGHARILVRYIAGGGRWREICRDRRLGKAGAQSASACVLPKSLVHGPRLLCKSERATFTEAGRSQSARTSPCHP